LAHLLTALSVLLGLVGGLDDLLLAPAELLLCADLGLYLTANLGFELGPKLVSNLKFQLLT